MNLYEFTHIPLLKNDTQLEQKSDKKKSNHPNLLGNKNHIQKKKSHLKKNHKRKQKKKKKEQWIGVIGQAHLLDKFLPLGFLSILQRKHFGGLGEKTLGLHQFFSPLPSNQISTKKISLPIFSLKFSVHPISPSTKHILSELILCE